MKRSKPCVAGRKTETAQWPLRADWNSEPVVCTRWHQTKIPTGGGKDGVKLSSLESRWHNTPLRHGLLIWNIPRKLSASLPADVKECIDLWNGMATFLSVEHLHCPFNVPTHSDISWIPASSKWYQKAWDLFGGVETQSGSVPHAHFWFQRQHLPLGLQKKESASELQKQSFEELVAQRLAYVSAFLSHSAVLADAER